MEEIKTVIDQLKEKYDELDHLNSEDLNSINEKQANIDHLGEEINGLQKDIEARKEDMAKLEKKISEAETFEKSIEEVVPLINEKKTPVVEEKEEVHEEVKEEPIQFEAPKEEVHEEPVTFDAPKEEVKEEPKEDAVYPFGDVVGEPETKEEPVAFDFKSTMNDFNEEETHEESKNLDIPTFTPGGPVFDERGFDISGNTNNTVSALDQIGLNEAYNGPANNDISMMIR